MVHKLRFAQVRLPERSAELGGTSEDRLPVGVALVIVAGINITIWSLIAIAIRSLI